MELSLIHIYFGLIDYFSFVGGSELDGTRKRKAEVIGYILETCEIKPQDAIMIGDRKHDIEGDVYKRQVYEDVEKQPVQGENIRKTKKEIEDSLDTMNRLFLHIFIYFKKF